jgi:L-ascorbate metabolism protein UlaG (beta-lactamase superfamily)
MLSHKNAQVFREIGDRLGPMDLSAIPIGAYAPRWFMAKAHIDAAEGLQVGQRPNPHPPHFADLTLSGSFAILLLCEDGR